MFLIILVFPLVVLEEVSGLQEEEDQWNKDAKVLFFPSKMKSRIPIKRKRPWICFQRPKNDENIGTGNTNEISSVFGNPLKTKHSREYWWRTDFWFFHCYFPNYRIFIFQSSFLCFGFYMKSNIAVTKRKIHENEDGIHGLFLFIGILLFILDSLGRGYKRSPRKRLTGGC